MKEIKNIIATEQQENEKGLKGFRELLQDVAQLPEQQQQSVALFAQGVIAASYLQQGIEAGAKHE